MDTGM